jgi:hypothetical protein
VVEAKQNDEDVRKGGNMLRSGVETPFQILEDKMITMDRKMYLPSDNAFKEKILKEAHESRFVVHPNSIKMYKYLKEFFWRPNMKKEIANYMVQCMICQLVKVEYQKPVGPLQSILIPEWKWEDIIMDFIIRFHRGKRGNDFIWVVED